VGVFDGRNSNALFIVHHCICGLGERTKIKEDRRKKIEERETKENLEKSCKHFEILTNSRIARQRDRETERERDKLKLFVEFTLFECNLFSFQVCIH
jgi:hypothetical protein